MHLRQTVEGRIVIGSDFGGTDPGMDPDATARTLFDQAKAMLEGGSDLGLDFHTVGYRPTPASGFPAIGRPDNQAGLYVAVMHSGVTLAPAVGQFVAQELLWAGAIRCSRLSYQQPESAPAGFRVPRYLLCRAALQATRTGTSVPRSVTMRRRW